MEEQLPKEKFLRIHNSYIIATDAVEVIHKDRVQIGDQQIPIGETYKKAFRDFVDGKHLG